MEKVLGWLVEYLTFFFFCLGQVLVAVCGIYFPNQGLNLGSLHWERGVLAIGPPGKSPDTAFKEMEQIYEISWWRYGVLFPSYFCMFEILHS